MTNYERLKRLLIVLLITTAILTLAVFLLELREKEATKNYNAGYQVGSSEMLAGVQSTILKELKDTGSLTLTIGQQKVILVPEGLDDSIEN